MSLDKSITFVASCDFCCHEYFDTDEENFNDAIEAMKKNGYKIYQQNGEWYHKGPDCLAAENDADFDAL